MVSVTSWLLAFFTAIFWLFRIVLTVATQYGNDFGGFIVFNTTMEIAVIFITLACFLLVLRRNIWGGIVYLVSYCIYFGSYIFSSFIPAFISGESLDMVVIQNTIVALLGIILALCTVIDIAVQKTKAKHFTDNKTDWYFNNDKYDRKMDERADKNQYRTL